MKQYISGYVGFIEISVLIFAEQGNNVNMGIEKLINIGLKFILLCIDSGHIKGLNNWTKAQFYVALNLVHTFANFLK